MPSDQVTISNRANEANLDEMRLANYRNRVKDQHETELRDLQSKSDGEITRTLERQAALAEDLRRDYDLKISAEAQELEDRLQKQRLAGEEKLAVEKSNADKEFDRVRTQNQKRIEQYQKNSEARVEAIRKQEQANTASLQSRAHKLERRIETAQATNEREAKKGKAEA